jgi:hypothetical protein
MDSLGAVPAVVKLIGVVLALVVFFRGLIGGKASLRRLRRDQWRWRFWI